jgi:hypothetical protein
MHPALHYINLSSTRRFFQLTLLYFICMMGSLKPEVPYGRRLIPPLIDNIARDNPNKVFASIPKSFDLTEGYIDVTYDAFSRAINRAAAFLEDRFGKSTSFETLAYLGPLDIRYFVLICAVCKVGYKVSHSMRCST